MSNRLGLCYGWRTRSRAMHTDRLARRILGPFRAAARGALPDAHPARFLRFQTQVFAVPRSPVAPVAALGNILILGVPGLALAGAIIPFADAFVDDLYDLFNAHVCSLSR